MADWHMVGRLEELPTDQLIPRTVAATNIVLLRTGDVVTALRDRCPHRFAPLSLGKVVNGLVQCPYHGLRFGLDGKCVFNPHGDGTIPNTAKVGAYEVEERDGSLFVRVG